MSATSKKSARIGMVLDGKYELLSEIGRGGMSIVYLARDRRLNKLWAVKEFQQTGTRLKDKVFRQSLLDEANLMKGLSHPALPRITDIIEADNTIFIVMDYVEGEDLKSVMRRNGRPMDEKDVIDWGIQLCDVLDYLHTPDPKKNKPAIVYRDMKPENVMLRDDGALCLIDFGIARKFDEAKSSDTTILGTREYAAPEQFDESVQTDWRADIYSLGVTLHYLVTGRSPKKNIGNLQPIREYNPQLSEGLESIIAKCVRPSRDERYQSCREISYDLEHYETLTEAHRKRLVSKVRTFGVLAGAAVLFLAVGIGGMVLSNAERASTFEYQLSLGDSIALAPDAKSGDADYEEKVAAYLDAIGTDPSRVEPYEELINAFVQDGDLASDEANTYYHVLEDSAKSSCSEYAELCYNFANVYFNYTTNFSQASTWFANALGAGGLSEELTTNANTLIAICDFRKDLDSREMLGDFGESQMFVEYWNRLGEALAMVRNASVMPRAKLKLCELILDACSSEAYTLPLMFGGVDKQELLDREQEAYELVESLSGQLALAADRELSDYISLKHHGGVDSDGLEVEPAASVIERTYNSTYSTAHSGASGSLQTSLLAESEEADGMQEGGTDR